MSKETRYLKGVIFRLYTEDANRDRIEQKINAMKMRNLTLHNATGKYNGIDEPTLIIELIIWNDNYGVNINDTRRIFRELSDYIKLINKQECVLLTEQPIKFELY